MVQLLPSQFRDRLGLLQRHNGPVKVPGVPDHNVVVVMRGESMIEPGVNADAIHGTREVAGRRFPTETNTIGVIV